MEHNFSFSFSNDHRRNGLSCDFFVRLAGQDLLQAQITVLPDIERVDPARIKRELDQKRIVIVTGFQGVNRYQDMTTLGRGGSDTSAVAIAASMHADLCQIYTDVEGVFTADPRKIKDARKLDVISYDEMLELATLGAQVLNNRSVEMAKKYGVTVGSAFQLNKKTRNNCKGGK